MRRTFFSGGRGRGEGKNVVDTESSFFNGAKEHVAREGERNMHNVKPNKNDDKMMINIYIYIHTGGGERGGSDIRFRGHTLHLTERKPPQERAAPSLVQHPDMDLVSRWHGTFEGRI